MNLENVLFDAILPSMFDPKQLEFREQDERGVKPVRNACTNFSNSVHHFKPTLNRNAFLCGCLDFTNGSKIEHLIVGLGDRFRATTKVICAIHTSGSENSVSRTVVMQDAIDRHLKESKRPDVIVFHNHPANCANTLFDNLPIASGQDRAVMLRTNIQPLAIPSAHTNSGRTLFFLGENGFVREFLTQGLSSFMRAHFPKQW